MSYQNGPPKIVTDGLVLMLDPIISKSYPGSGNTIYDLSGRGNNGTINGATYWSDGRGSFNFNGTNNYILLPTNFFAFPSLNTFTISLWFKSSQTTGGTLFAQQNTTNPSSAGGWVPVIYLRSDGRIRIEPFWTGSVSNNILSLSALNDNIWHNITTTFNSGTNQLYIDGIYQSQQTGKTLSSFTSTYYYIVGAGYSAGRSLGTNYFSGNIANFSFYNTSILPNQVLQNYNATKYRFDL
jgi:hypothetical protein